MRRRAQSCSQPVRCAATVTQKNSVAVAYVKRGKGELRLNGAAAAARHGGRERPAGAASAAWGEAAGSASAAGGARGSFFQRRQRWVDSVGSGSPCGNWSRAPACQQCIAGCRGEGAEKAPCLVQRCCLAHRALARRAFAPLQAPPWTWSSPTRCGTRCTSRCCCWASRGAGGRACVRFFTHRSIQLGLWAQPSPGSAWAQLTWASTHMLVPLACQESGPGSGGWSGEGRSCGGAPCTALPAAHAHYRRLLWCRFANVDIRIRVKGGGHVSQIFAIRQAIAKGIVAFYQKCEWAGPALPGSSVAPPLELSVGAAGGRGCGDAGNAKWRSGQHAERAGTGAGRAVERLGVEHCGAVKATSRAAEESRLWRREKAAAKAVHAASGAARAESGGGGGRKRGTIGGQCSTALRAAVLGRAAGAAVELGWAGGNGASSAVCGSPRVAAPPVVTRTTNVAASHPMHARLQTWTSRARTRSRTCCWRTTGRCWWPTRAAPSPRSARAPALPAGGRAACSRVMLRGHRCLQQRSCLPAAVGGGRLEGCVVWQLGLRARAGYSGSGDSWRAPAEAAAPRVAAAGRSACVSEAFSNSGSGRAAASSSRGQHSADSGSGDKRPSARGARLYRTSGGAAWQRSSRGKLLLFCTL